MATLECRACEDQRPCKVTPPYFTRGTIDRLNLTFEIDDGAAAVSSPLLFGGSEPTKGIFVRALKHQLKQYVR